MPRSPILNASFGFLRDLDAQADAAIRAMMLHYERTQRDMLAALQRLQAQMESIENPTKGQLYRLDRYQEMLRQITREMNATGRQLATAVQGVTDDAAAVGVNAAGELVFLQGNYAALKGAFMVLDTQGIATAVSFTQPGSPLMTMLTQNYGAGWAEVFAGQYVSGVAMGWSPRRIIAALNQTVTTATPADIARIVRTAQIWAYRETNARAWQQSGVVDHWTWSATLDDTTCGSCWSMHGTKHPVEEVLDDHYNGRCAMLPAVTATQDYAASETEMRSGEEEFSRLSPARQEEISSGGGWGAQYRAWQDGAIKWGDMAMQTNDDVYGTMRGMASLKALLGDKASQYYG